jgi:hypothetical protein
MQLGNDFPQFEQQEIIFESIIFYWLFCMVTKFFSFDLTEKETLQKKHLAEFSNAFLSVGSFDNPYLLNFVTTLLLGYTIF